MLVSHASSMKLGSCSTSSDISSNPIPLIYPGRRFVFHPQSRAVNLRNMQPDTINVHSACEQESTGCTCEEMLTTLMIRAKAEDSLPLHSWRQRGFRKHAQFMFAQALMSQGLQASRLLISRTREISFRRGPYRTRNPHCPIQERRGSSFVSFAGRLLDGYLII
jgi:hypothetical protein